MLEMLIVLKLDTSRTLKHGSVVRVIHFNFLELPCMMKSDCDVTAKYSGGTVSAIVFL